MMKSQLEAKSPFVGFALWIGLLVVMFFGPLKQWVQFAASSDLFSHVLLIPVVTVYLLWTHPDTGPLRWNRSWAGAAVCAVAALGLWLLGRALEQRGAVFAPVDRIALSMATVVGFVYAGALASFGWSVIQERLFPVVFLVFVIPFPTAVTEAISVFLQHQSANVSHYFIAWTGTPVLRDGLVFKMPGLDIRVAEECSGIHSTVVLFVTSLLAGHLFLRSGWRRGLFALAVVPLGILRNAVRITTISWLTVHVDPGIIKGPLHHRGGPYFFALSLIPLFALLLWLRRSEGRRRTSKVAETPAISPCAEETTR